MAAMRGGCASPASAATPAARLKARAGVDRAVRACLCLPQGRHPPTANQPAAGCGEDACVDGRLSPPLAAPTARRTLRHSDVSVPHARLPWGPACPDARCRGDRSEARTGLSGAAL